MYTKTIYEQMDANSKLIKAIESFCIVLQGMTYAEQNRIANKIFGNKSNK